MTKIMEILSTLPGAAALIQTFLLEPLLKKYAPVPQEGSEEAGKWYYQ